jgi:hypothetical protein
VCGGGGLLALAALDLTCDAGPHFSTLWSFRSLPTIVMHSHQMHRPKSIAEMLWKRPTPNYFDRPNPSQGLPQHSEALH